MNDNLFLAGALFAGVVVGLLYFGGLWWTVQKSVSSSQPGLLIAGSFLLRTLLTLGAFYLIGQGSWQRLLAALLGFIVGRVVVNRFGQVPLGASPKEGVQ